MRTRRTIRLIATFENGYAKGWAFAVKPCFRDQLDIRLTERIIDKKPQRAWTQGRNFCFSVGDTIYSTPFAYEDWDAAIIRGGFRYVKIIDAKPAENPDAEDGGGFVKFGLHKVNCRNKHSLFGTFTMPQHAFVKFLRRGVLEELEVDIPKSDTFIDKKSPKIPLGETARITDIRRSIERLYGILIGISCDGEINESEIQALKSWLPLHDNLRMHQPFYSVRQVLAQNDFKAENLLTCCLCFIKSDFVVPRDGSIIRRFHGILQGIACDGIINDKEIDCVRQWIDKNAQPVRYDWPISEFRELAGRHDSNLLNFCNQFYEKGISAPAPQKNIPAFMRSPAPLVEPIQCATDLTSKIEFNGHTFCFTGASKNFSRKELQNKVETLGGTSSNQVSYSLDYLVICGQGNPNWSFSTYGRKIAQAIEFNRTPDPHVIRKKILIIEEERLLNEIEKRGI